MARRKAVQPVQAWVTLAADDPEAVSALGVARHRLAAGAALESLRRLRLFELSGRMPGALEIAERLHGSTQFYNPHKESCVVRVDQATAAPLGPGEWLVLVVERGGDRRPAAERWWLHETGQKIEVREGVAWALRFARSAGAEAAARALADLEDRAHGLLANPHSQDAVVMGSDVPLPVWNRFARSPHPEERA